MSRYFKDFVKVRRVELDLDAVLFHFDDGLKTFHRLMLPVMAWIVAAKGSGVRVNLHDLNPGELIQVNDEGSFRKLKRDRLAYLCRVCQVSPGISSWTLLRRTYAELRRLSPKSYIRGKFEAWWFIQFGQCILEGITTVVQESNGSVKVAAPLHIGTLVQLLAAGIPTPIPLHKFFTFHTLRNANTVQPPTGKRHWLQMLSSLFRRD